MVIPNKVQGAPLPGGEQFFSAGMPGETFTSDIPYQTMGVGIAAEATASVPWASESFIPSYNETGELVGWKPKGQPGAIVEGGQYLDRISYQNYTNAARLANIYSRIQKRLDDPSNDLMEELERQFEVQYEALRSKFAMDDYDLMGQLRRGEITQQAYKFLSEGAQNTFREGEMKLKAGREETIAKWRFQDKDAAKLIEKGEAPDLVARVNEQKKAKMINFDLPGLVRGQEDRMVAWAGFERDMASGMRVSAAAVKNGLRLSDLGFSSFMEAEMYRDQILARGELKPPPTGGIVTEQNVNVTGIVESPLAGKGKQFKEVSGKGGRKFIRQPAVRPPTTGYNKLQIVPELYEETKRTAQFPGAGIGGTFSEIKLKSYRDLITEPTSPIPELQDIWENYDPDDRAQFIETANTLLNANVVQTREQFVQLLRAELQRAQERLAQEGVE